MKTRTGRTLAAMANLLAAGAAQAVPVISPFAADLAGGAYTADNTAGGPAQSAFNGGYWNAGAWYTHWIQADMGSVLDFTFALTSGRFLEVVATGGGPGSGSRALMLGGLAALTPLTRRRSAA